MVHYDLKADYRKVRTTNAFDTYFFDAASGKILHKDLRRLFDSSSKEDSINIAKELYNADQTSLLQYLQSRTIKVLGTKDKLERYLEVLLYLYHYSNRNASIESLFVSFGILIYMMILRILKYSKHKTNIKNGFRHLLKGLY